MTVIKEDSMPNPTLPLKDLEDIINSNVIVTTVRCGYTWKDIVSRILYLMLHTIQML